MHPLPLVSGCRRVQKKALFDTSKKRRRRKKEKRKEGKGEKGGNMMIFLKWVLNAYTVLGSCG